VCVCVCATSIYYLFILFILAQECFQRKQNYMMSNI